MPVLVPPSMEAALMSYIKSDKEKVDFLLSLDVAFNTNLTNKCVGQLLDRIERNIAQLESELIKKAP